MGIKSTGQVCIRVTPEEGRQIEALARAYQQEIREGLGLTIDVTPTTILHSWIVDELRKVGLSDEPSSMHELVYIIQEEGEQGLIKIGFTCQLGQRLSTLRSTSRVPLKVLHTMPGSRQLEHELHARFEFCRVKPKRGDWFRPAPELLDFVMALGLKQS